jgi:hypothetical protein
MTCFGIFTVTFLSNLGLTAIYAVIDEKAGEVVIINFNQEYCIAMVLI